MVTVCDQNGSVREAAFYAFYDFRVGYPPESVPYSFLEGDIHKWFSDIFIYIFLDLSRGVGIDAEYLAQVGVACDCERQPIFLVFPESLFMRQNDSLVEIFNL